MLMTRVYVEGFNLCCGALGGRPYRWQDLQALWRVLLPRVPDAWIDYDKTDVPEFPGLTARILGVMG